MNDVVKIVVAGAGLVGKQHIHALSQADNVELAAIVDPDVAVDALASMHSVQRYPSISALFDSQSPDGIVLATPTLQHVEQGDICLQRGCPMLIEKPLADQSTSAAALVAKAEKVGIPILVGHHRRHNPIIAKAKSLVESGVLGQVRSAHSNCWFYKPDDYFAVAPWRTQKGAGPVSVNLVHDVDLLRHLVGEVISVQAQACPSIRGFEIEDLASAILEFDTGAVATVSVSDSIVAPWSWEHTAQENPAYPVTNQHSLVLGGSEASLSIPDLQLWYHPDKKSWNDSITATAMVRPFASPLVVQLEHFARVIKGVDVPLVSGKEGLQSLRVVEAIAQAAESKERVLLSI